ncbi:MAG: glutathione peroxidase [Clostridiales bacterium]|jgi:glutathione peroxidase|nr:glutathione peroxidase [Clostridiales bacterium]
MAQAICGARNAPRTKAARARVTLLTADLEQIVYEAMVEKLREFHTLNKQNKSGAVNPKAAALKVELARVEDEIEKLINTLYRERGLVVIGFPCNQFLHQEPGENEQIQEFCTVRYGVTFPLSRKIDVKGANALPLFKAFSGGKAIQWNFAKFLIDRSRNLAERFGSMTKSEQLVPHIEKLL